MRSIEAILFSCGRKIGLDELGKLVKVGSPGPLKSALKKLQKEYDDRGSPMMISEDGDGWKMSVREKYLRTVRKITPYMEFSKTLMETLAVVAWKQPIVQSDVIRIRTNKAYDHIAELEKMGFLSKERHGRSYLLKLSQKFYDYFDLRDDVDVRNLFKHVKDIEPEEQKKVVEYEKEKEPGGVVPEKKDDAAIPKDSQIEKKPADVEGGLEKAERAADEREVLEVDDMITGEKDRGEQKEADIEEQKEKDGKSS